MQSTSQDKRLTYRIEMKLNAPLFYTQSLESYYRSNHLAGKGGSGLYPSQT